MVATHAEIVEGTLANYTGSGFGGDLGFKTAVEIFELDREEFEHHDMTPEDVGHALEWMVTQSKAVRTATGYAFPPTQCVRCNNDPCTCGIGTWR